MKKIKAVVFGAGNRGLFAYAPYAAQHPDEIELVAVAEPLANKREAFCERYGLPAERAFADYRAFFEENERSPIDADLILVCTQDNDHYLPAKLALQSGYHVLVEKPIANSITQCRELELLSQSTGRQLGVCFVLRYTPFYKKIKEMIDSGVIGDVVSMQHNEAIGFYHIAHSYVRGNWRRREETNPILLAKSSHDLDLLYWFAGAECDKISSFGCLRHFTPENKPGNTPARCLDGCRLAEECPYYAPKIYFARPDLNTWPANVVSPLAPTAEALTEALRTGPYGRCVYACDNDVFDSQVVGMQFKNGVTADFNLCGMNTAGLRFTRIFGTKGDLQCNFEAGTIHLSTFCSYSGETITVSAAKDMHGGGDFGAMREFIGALREGRALRTSVTQGIESHYMGFAAEEALANNTVVRLDAFKQAVQAGLPG